MKLKRIAMAILLMAIVALSALNATPWCTPGESFSCEGYQWEQCWDLCASVPNSFGTCDCIENYGDPLDPEQDWCAYSYSCYCNLGSYGCQQV